MKQLRVLIQIGGARADLTQPIESHELDELESELASDCASVSDFLSSELARMIAVALTQAWLANSDEWASINAESVLPLAITHCEGKAMIGDARECVYNAAIHARNNPSQMMYLTTDADATTAEARDRQ